MGNRPVECDDTPLLNEAIAELLSGFCGPVTLAQCVFFYSLLDSLKSYP